MTATSTVVSLHRV